MMIEVLRLDMDIAQVKFVEVWETVFSHLQVDLMVGSNWSELLYCNSFKIRELKTTQTVLF